MPDVETRLAERLRATAAKAVPQPDIEAVRAGGSVVEFEQPRRTRVGPRLLGAAAVAALAVAGVVVLALDDGDSTTETQPTSPQTSPPTLPAPAPVEWATPQVRLSADDFAITASGKRFTAQDVEVEVVSDPGDAYYTSLELKWTEHNAEMRWYIYFQSDGNEWWADEMRTYNGSGEGDWVTFYGDFFRSPLGETFRGSLDETATELDEAATPRPFTSRLRITGLEVQAFLDASTGATTTTPVTPPPPSQPAVPVNWETPHLRLTADDLALTVDGERYTGEGAQFSSERDETELTRLIVTLVHEGRRADVELRFYRRRTEWGTNVIYLAVGPGDGGVIDLRGNWVKSSLGEPFRGDVDAMGSSDSGTTARLQITGMTVELLDG